MDSFLLLALTAGLLSPIAAKAESYKLVYQSYNSTSVLTMANKELCEEGKKRILQKSEWDGKLNIARNAAICIKSK